MLGNQKREQVQRFHGNEVQVTGGRLPQESYGLQSQTGGGGTRVFFTGTSSPPPSGTLRRSSPCPYLAS